MCRTLTGRDQRDGDRSLGLRLQQLQVPLISHSQQPEAAAAAATVHGHLLPGEAATRTTFVKLRQKTNPIAEQHCALSHGFVSSWKADYLIIYSSALCSVFWEKVGINTHTLITAHCGQRDSVQRPLSADVVRERKKGKNSFMSLFIISLWEPRIKYIHLNTSCSHDN